MRLAGNYLYAATAASATQATLTITPLRFTSTPPLKPMAPPYWVHTAIGAASTAIRGLHIWSMHTNSSKKHWLRVLSLSIILLGQVAMCILYRYRFDIAIVIAIILSMGFYVCLYFLVIRVVINLAIGLGRLRHPLAGPCGN